MVYTPIEYKSTFENKLAIVTGGASGIGKATVEALCYYGAHVSIFDIDRKKGNQLERALSELGHKSTFYYCDVRQSEDVEKVLSQTIKENNANPYILVNNASIDVFDDGDFITMSIFNSKNIVDTNLWGYVNMLRSVVPLMRKGGGGRIVNVSSIQAVQSCKPGTLYQLTKGAVIGLTGSMNIEYGRGKIRTNTVLPGGVSTEGMGNVGGDFEILRPLKEATPLGRRGTPYEIAEVILFQLSDKASYVQGEHWRVTGGLSGSLLPDTTRLPVKDDPDV